jgi:hypothetical protein
MTETIFRCYDTSTRKNGISTIVGNGIFDLIGTDEPCQTKSLGYVLARSKKAMESFLKCVYGKRNRMFAKLMSDKYTIDCELLLPKADGNSLRADIVINFPQNKTVIIVEAKTVKSKCNAKEAIYQGLNYAKLMRDNNLIDEETFGNKIVVGLTNDDEYFSLDEDSFDDEDFSLDKESFKSFKVIKWSDIINLFDNIDDYLVIDYKNYLLKNSRYMNYYDVEVLSISAKYSIEGVKQVGVYECPASYSTGKRRPLYMAFRGEGGRVDTLYKVAELKKMPIEGTEYEKIKLNMNKNEPEIVAKIDKYREIVPHNRNDEEVKWVFILDIEKSIKLPNPVVCERNNLNVDKSHGLSDYFSSPEKINKYKDEEVVVFKTKKSQKNNDTEK